MVGCSSDPAQFGDLSEIRQRGTIRIVVPGLPQPVLPRSGHIYDWEKDALLQFARQLDLDTEVITVSSRDELLASLIEGRGDILASNLSVTEARDSLVDFTDPLGILREVLVARDGDTVLSDVQLLANRTIHVRRSSAFWQTARRLADSIPGVMVEAVSENLSTEGILHGVSTGRYDVTIADDNLFEEVTAYMPELRSADYLLGTREQAWAVREGAVELKEALDRFVARNNFNTAASSRHFDDLDGLRQRGAIRLLTRNSPTTYYLWKGELLGFEYDLVREFARQNGLRLELVVPPSRSALLVWLEQGRGDIVAAGLSIGTERGFSNVSTTRPYNFVSEVVVGRADEDSLTSVNELSGRTLAIRRSSSYWETAQEIRESGIDVRIRLVPENVETADIIDDVASGRFDLTIADSHILAVELAARNDIRGLLPVSDTIGHGWAVRSENPQLLQALNRFIRSEYRGRFYNITYNRYFRSPEEIQEQIPERTAVTGRISDFDHLFQEAAGEAGLDWRLIAAMSWQESRFSPEAESHMGAQGLMQLLPSTAEAYGAPDPFDPEANVRAGVSYLSWQLEMIDNAATEDDRLWFALASYNAGFGHLSDARRLAEEHGLDPNRWFGNVAEVMPLLQRREYFSRSAHGYCRCTEPVHYVQTISRQFSAYVGTLSDGLESTGGF